MGENITRIDTDHAKPQIARATIANMSVKVMTRELTGIPVYNRRDSQKLEKH